jgi:hypothetical protein
MKTFLLVFLTIGFLLLGFCCWGLSTVAGQTAFPEMAGLLPFYSGVLGGAVILLTILILGFRHWRSRWK